MSISSHDDIIVIRSESYPENLRQMSGKPKELFMRGTLPDENQKYLCVVGSRLASNYGKDVCKKLIEGLSGYPISIVSGLAIGIDSLSHEAALDTGLHCVGFPGSSLDWNRIYPTSSTSLAKRIIDSGGALLSEIAVDIPYADWAFPSRNRFMAGLSHATLIIEAKQGSGALMTADHALSFNRDVMAVPGSIFSYSAYGPHMLIRQGATPVTSSDDILQVLGFGPRPDLNTESLAYKNLDALSKQILDQLRTGEKTLDDLKACLHITSDRLGALITDLELCGFIGCSGGTFRLN